MVGLSDVVGVVESVVGGGVGKGGEGGKVEVVQYPEGVEFVSGGRLCEVFFFLFFFFLFSSSFQ